MAGAALAVVAQSQSTPVAPVREYPGSECYSARQARSAVTDLTSANFQIFDGKPLEDRGLFSTAASRAGDGRFDHFDFMRPAAFHVPRAGEHRTLIVQALQPLETGNLFVFLYTLTNQGDLVLIQMQSQAGSGQVHLLLAVLADLWRAIGPNRHDI
jgi:hypothetical protein